MVDRDVDTLQFSEQQTSTTHQACIHPILALHTLMKTINY
jgi:hypothetical protein